MIFKCEKVDEELREKFYQEQMVLKERLCFNNVLILYTKFC